MVVTIEFMEKYFPIFNNRFFEGKLRKPTFEIIHTARCLGNFQPCKDLTYFGNPKFIEVIRMSDYYDRSEHDLCETFVHEMIHLWTFQTPNPSDPSTHLPVDHGKWFKQKAAEINSVSDFHISRLSDGMFVKNKNKGNR